MKRGRSVLRTIVAPIVIAVVLVPTLVIAAYEVLHGRGAAVYTNVYGLAIHYTSVLILVAPLTFTLVVAYVARLVYFWRYGRGGVTELREFQPRTPYTDPAGSK
jgi:hypothetical protein